ncbi:hypothetical protein FH972_002852 [Carpinus fangiana]|uniref:Bulb-type lectin domain-containing protein n=1 Tax=Carpinus fangiana TaxID=176857 RepID=A0A5N6QIS7_9ROSI|nr:hypothetical protein FH972_002852 [Carpinus fangiana]
MAGIPEKTVVWTANRDDPPVSSNATLLFASDGRLVLQMGQEPVAVVAESSGSASASMLNSGNFVIYNSDQGIIWQSFDYPTDTLLPSQRLFAGHEIVSSISETQHSTGIFRLKMQTNGNLVQYPVDTPDTAPYSFYTSFNIRNLTAKETIYRTTIDVDGIFRLYSHNLKTERKLAECVCLPGFEMVQQGNWTAGCERNFTVESWNSKNGDIKYNMQEEANTVWEDASYSALTMPYKDSCAQACLADCNCEAVLFKDGKCKKQRLPLRYGRRQLTDSSIALIKVKEEAVLEEWAYHCFQAGDLAKLLGDEEVDMKQVERMVKLGIWCIQDEPSLQPSMKKVLLMLEGTNDILIPPSPTSFS